MRLEQKPVAKALRRADSPGWGMVGTSSDAGLGAVLSQLVSWQPAGHRPVPGHPARQVESDPRHVEHVHARLALTESASMVDATAPDLRPSTIQAERNEFRRRPVRALDPGAHEQEISDDGGTRVHSRLHARVPEGRPVAPANA